MGFIKKIFGGIFGLIGSILGGIAGIFGLGKKSEYYLELDESEQSTAADSSPAPQPAPQANQATQAPSAVDQAAPVKVTAEPQKQEKGSFKEQIPTGPQSSAQAKPPAESTQAKMPQIANFATDYLVNPRVNRSPRRRPGPSLSPFKEMAQEMGRKSPSMG